MRPQLPDTETSRKTVREIGFRDAPMHLEAELTSQLDLTPSEAMLLSNMRKTTRYEIRRAEKLGISVTKTTDTAAIGGFHALQLETARRQNFTPFSYPYLSEQFRSFADHGMAMLYSATYQGNLLAQAFMIFYGSEAVYHYGASTDAGRTYPGAYIIQWAAIRDAKPRGMKRYNFWGVTSPADINHRFYGVSVFKRGFGGEDVSYLHAQDLVMHPGRYTVNLAVETVRRKIRRL
jgi:lipid II:glycine glycyltransferase (peptidoglycan interpeptide bridge formation enzyme)